MTETDDKTLIRRCLSGDTRAFESLVDRYQKPVFNLAMRMVNNYDEARDIAQSVFIKAFEKLNSFDERYRFFSWIYRITVNESINFINKEKRRKELSEHALPRVKTPAESFDDHELSDRIWDAVVDLQVKYRIVIMLRYFHSLTYSEISYILGIPEKTVKSRLFTARRLLSDIFTERGMMS